VIFVVFLLPLGLYLLVIGHLNRQPRPVFVSGPMDFVGVLFAASGFLTFGGPAILTALNESWRSFWLLGEVGGRESLLAQWRFWVFLFVLYFVVVVGTSAYVFRRRRGLTSVYNVDPKALEAALAEVCQQHGLSPIRAGRTYRFGPAVSPEQQAKGAGPTPEGIQVRHELLGVTPRLGVGRPAAPAAELAGQAAVLELEVFRPLRHVTLCWEPHDSPLRVTVEEELEARLAAAGAPYHETALWLTMAGYAVLGAALFVGTMLLVRTLLMRE
jgi:hypothetical protein